MPNLTMPSKSYLLSQAALNVRDRAYWKAYLSNGFDEFLLTYEYWFWTRHLPRCINHPIKELLEDYERLKEDWEARVYVENEREREQEREYRGPSRYAFDKDA